MSWYETRPITHRGLHDNVEIPENSMMAFRAAIEKNYAFEFDVHLSSDGDLVVVHDHNLQRLTGVDVEIESSTSDSIRALKLLNSQESIPRLADVLALVDGSVPILVEVKNEGKIGELEAKLLEVLREYTGEFAIQSFNPFALAYFAKNAPDMKRGQLSGSFDGETLPLYVKFILSNMLLNFKSKPDFIAYEGLFLSKLAVRIRRFFKTPILAWTIENELEKLAVKRDSDNIIFKFFLP